MTSPRRRRDRAIESVELNVTLGLDAATIAKVRRTFHSAVLKDGTLRLKFKGSAAEMEEKTKALLKLVRTPAGRASTSRSDKRL